jgi:hypothetical protein
MDKKRISHDILNSLDRLRIMHDLAKDQNFSVIGREEILTDLESTIKSLEADLKLLLQ